MPTDNDRTRDFDAVTGGRVRVREVSRMVPEHGELSAIKRREIIATFKQYIDKAGVSQADVAKLLNLSPGVVSNVLTEKGNISGKRSDEILLALNNWIEDDRVAKEAARKRPTDFVETRVAKSIFGVANFLRQRADVALVYGGSGVGKTMTMRAIVSDIPGTIGITVDGFSRSARGLQITLCNAGRERNRRTSVDFRDLVERYTQASDVSLRRLLIIDQAHRLRDAALDVLMDLHDACAVSIMLLGTVDLRERLSADADEQFGQYWSRIGIRVNLHDITDTGGKGTSKKLFTVPDIRRIFRKAQLKLHSDAAKMLAGYANESIGHLRFVTRLFDWALALAEKQKAREITKQHIEKAHRFVTDEQEIALPASYLRGEYDDSAAAREASA